PLALARLSQEFAGRVDPDPVLDGDLEDLPLLVLVDELVVVGPQLDLIDEPRPDLFRGHDRHSGGGALAGTSRRGGPDFGPAAGVQRVYRRAGPRCNGRPDTRAGGGSAARAVERGGSSDAPNGPVRRGGP